MINFSTALKALNKHCTSKFVSTKSKANKQIAKAPVKKNKNNPRFNHGLQGLNSLTLYKEI